MIPTQTLKKQLSANDIEKYCGIKLRDNEEVLICDQVSSKYAYKKGERTWKEGKVYLPIRSYNFKFAIWKALNKRETRTVDKTVFLEAMKILREDCFDLAEDPVNVADKLFDMGYIKLMRMVDEDTRDMQINL